MLTPEDVVVACSDLGDSWEADRGQRLNRQALDPADFDAIRATGFLSLIVPEGHGGLWHGVASSAPPIAQALYHLARGDHSVGLVASMHPAVVIYWAAGDNAPEPHRDAWTTQRAEVFASALDGHFFGTVASEPGSGGDVLGTKTTAVADPRGPGRYRLTGQKHFGSGSGISSYMMTTARVDGEELPWGFTLDLRDNAWDGSAGVRIARAWDGVGMSATQSHAIELDDAPATAWAWPGVLPAVGPISGAFGMALYASVIAAVVDAAVAEANRRLANRELRPYEEVEWNQALAEHWSFSTGVRATITDLHSIESRGPEAALFDAVRAKVALSELAESILRRLVRVVGGGSFSASSPFSRWYEDVRALGYLRPPWGLSSDMMTGLRTGADSDWRPAPTW